MSINSGRSSQELNLAGFQADMKQMLALPDVEFRPAFGSLNVAARKAKLNPGFNKEELRILLRKVESGEKLSASEKDRIKFILSHRKIDTYQAVSKSQKIESMPPQAPKVTLFGDARTISTGVYPETSSDLISVDPSVAAGEEALASFPPDPEPLMSEADPAIDFASAEADGTVGDFSTDEPQEQAISDAWEAKNWTPPKGNWWKETRAELHTLFEALALFNAVNRHAASLGLEVSISTIEISDHQETFRAVMKNTSALADKQAALLKALLYIEDNLHHVEESDTLIIRVVLKKWLGRELQIPESVSNKANTNPNAGQAPEPKGVTNILADGIKAFQALVAEGEGTSPIAIGVEAAASDLPTLPVRYAPSARNNIDYSVLSAALAEFSQLLHDPSDTLKASVAESFRKSRMSVDEKGVQQEIKFLSDQISEAHASFEELLQTPDIAAEKLETWTRQHSGLSALSLVLTGQGHRPHARAILDLTEGHLNSAWEQTLGEILASPMGIHVHELEEIMRRSFKLHDTPNMRQTQETIARRVFERPDLAKAFADAGVTEHGAINIIEAVLASDAAALLPVDAPELAQASPVGLEALNEQEIAEIQKILDVVLGIRHDVNLGLTISLSELKRRAGWVGRGTRIFKANFNRRHDLLRSTNPRSRAAITSTTAHICNLVAVIRADRIIQSRQSTPILSSILRKLMPTLAYNTDAQEHTLKNVAKNWAELSEPAASGRSPVRERSADLARANEIATAALEAELTRLANQKKSRLIEARGRVVDTYRHKGTYPVDYQEAVLEFTNALYDLFKGDLGLRHARYAGIARDIQSERGFLTFLTNYQNAELMSEWLSERGFSNFDLGPKPIQSIAYTGLRAFNEQSQSVPSGIATEPVGGESSFEAMLPREARSDRIRSRVGRPARGTAEFIEERRESLKSERTGRKGPTDVEEKARSKPRGRGPGGMIKGK